MGGWRVGGGGWEVEVGDMEGGWECDGCGKMEGWRMEGVWEVG